MADLADAVVDAPQGTNLADLGQQLTPAIAPASTSPNDLSDLGTRIQIPPTNVGRSFKPKQVDLSDIGARQADPISYSVQNGEVHFDDERPYTGAQQALNDGVITQDKFERFSQPLLDVQTKRQTLIQAAGSNSRAQALVAGAAKGGAFLAGTGPGARIGAGIGVAAVGGPEDPLAAIAGPVGAGIGALVGGGVSEYVAKRAAGALADYNDTVKGLLASEELHPVYDAAGNLLAFGASIPKSLANIRQLASIAYSDATDAAASAGMSADQAAAAGRAAAVKAVGKQVGGGAIGGAVVTAAQPAIDYAGHLVADQLGIDHDQAVQTPTMGGLLTNVGLGILTAGHNLAFRNYDAAQVANVAMRGAAREAAGIPLNQNDPAAVIRGFQKLGGGNDADLQSNGLLEPMDAGEIALYAKLKDQVSDLKETGKLGSNQVDITKLSARQALLPGINQTPLTSAVIGLKPIEGEVPHATNPVGDAGGVSSELARTQQIREAPVSPEPRDSVPGPAGQPTPPAAQAPAAPVTPVQTQAPAAPVSSAPPVAPASAPGGPQAALPPALQAQSAAANAPAAWAGSGMPGTTPAQPIQTGTAAGASSPAIKTPAAPTSNVPPGSVEQPKSQAQAEAGNYKQADLTVHGLNIKVENRAGDPRQKLDDQGNVLWRVEKMPADYGRLQGTKGADGDQLDVYVGPHPESVRVFVVNQKNLQTGKFDETKSLLGFNTQNEAIAAYDAGFSDGKGPDRRETVVPTDIVAFKKWLKNGDITKPYPMPVAKTPGGRSIQPKAPNVIPAPTPATQAKSVSQIPAAGPAEPKPTQPAAPAPAGAGLPNVERPSGVDEGQPAGVPPAAVPQQPTPAAPGPSDAASAGSPVPDGVTGTVAGSGEGSGLPAGGGAAGRPGVPGGPTAQAAIPGVQPEPGAVGAADFPAPRKAAELSPSEQNFRITADTKIGAAGDVSKARSNIAAIRLLRELEEKRRLATPEEKLQLAQYVGWGGLKQLFDRARFENRQHLQYLGGDERRAQENWEKQWGRLADELRKLLTDQEWEAAAHSMLNAHYTSLDVIRHGLWALATRLGFKGGNTLENSAGIGSVIGLTPDSVVNRTKWCAVEMDDITARMLHKLYPQSLVIHSPFEDATIKDNTVQLVIGNFPFSDVGPRDKRYPPLNLHNYFFVRSIDTLAPGGIIVAITSANTLDAPTMAKARQLMATKADFVGAIRLPNNAFKKNAGTEVTTDIIVFRKKAGVAFTGAEGFRDVLTGRTHDDKDIPLNEYFIRHPENILGKLSLEGKLYGGPSEEGQMTVLPHADKDLISQLNEAVTRFPQDIAGRANVSTEVFTAGERAEAGMEEGSYVIKPEDKQVYFVDGGNLVQPEWATGAKAKKLVEQAKAFVGVRDAAKDLIDKQFDPDASEGEIEAQRKALNKVYDAYVSKHGYFSQRQSEFLADDSKGYTLCLALEVPKQTTVERVVKGVKKPTTVVTYDKAEIFTKRTIYPREAPTRADTIDDAVSVSLAYQNSVNPVYIGQLLGKTSEEATAMLLASGKAFENPETGLLEAPDEYLSGFVKNKLRAAIAKAGEDPRYLANVQALQKVQPARLSIADIGFRLGGTWIPGDIISSFIKDVMEVNTTVSYQPETGKWFLTEHGGQHGSRNMSTFGGGDMTGTEIIEDVLNLKTPTVYDYVQDENGNKKAVKNVDKSLVAQQKADEIKRLFVEWARRDPSAAARMENVYNEVMNGTVRRQRRAVEFEGGTYPGANTEIMLRPHQKVSVGWCLENSMLLAHAVGLGKTYVIITAAMEMRRLGTAHKPMIVVQNATLHQFASDFLRLYPSARILVPTAKDRKAENRKRIMNRIATGDHDAVIIPQSFITQLADDPDRVRAYIEEQIQDLIRALAAMGRDRGRSPAARVIQKAIDTKREKLAELADRKVDRSLTFESLGVDALFVDEAHEFKHLEFASQMDNVKGIDKSPSKKGFGMLMKVRFVQERNNGKNVIFATGTPVSNTMAEAWTMMRYLRPDVLAQFHITNFDQFASTFGEIKNDFELTATGAWKYVSRFSSFTNKDELFNAFHTVADVKMNSQVELKGVPRLKNGRYTIIDIDPTPAVKEFIEYLKRRIAAYEAMSGRDKMLHRSENVVVFTLAKKASLDMRLIDPDNADEPGSKANRTVKEVYDRWLASKDELGTQLVFADLYQSPDEEKWIDPDETIPNPAYGKKRFNLYRDIKDKLVAKGIPAEQVELVIDNDTDAKRAALFAKVQDGAVRVMLGSTARMGTGVNVQRRCVAIHHMDCPPRPMDIEQRNGRGVRQGNKNDIIELVTYGVKRSLDAAMFQKNVTKQKFTNQVLIGDVPGRSFEDASDEVSMSFEEMMGAFSGDPMALEKVALEGKIRQMESMAVSHDRAVADGVRDIGYKGNTIANLEKVLPIERDRVARWNAAFATPDFKFAQAGKTLEDKKAINEALDKFFSDGMKRAQEAAKAGNHTHDFQHAIGDFTLNGIRFTCSAVVMIDFTTGKENPLKEPEIKWHVVNADGSSDVVEGQNRSANGFFMSLKSQIGKLQNAPQSTELQIANLKKDILELQGFVQQPYARAQELVADRQRLAEVRAQLEINAKAEKEKMDEQLRKGAGPAAASLSEGQGTPRGLEKAITLLKDKTAPLSAVGKTINTLGGDIAMGKEGISALLDRSKLPAETVRRGKFLLQEMPPELFHDMTLMLINDPSAVGGIKMQGSFYDLLNAAMILNSTEVGADGVSHELLHWLERFLPQGLRAQNERDWKQAVSFTLANANGNANASARELLLLIGLREGLTSKEFWDFIAGKSEAERAQLLALYHLANPSEFFAKRMADGTADRASRHWIMQLLRWLLDAVRKLFGLSREFTDRVWEAFQKNAVKPSPEDGMLFERNRGNRTSGAATLAETPSKTENALEAAAARSPRAVETEARLISGQNEFLRTSLEKFTGPNVSKAALHLLGYDDLLAINQKVAAVIQPEDYYAGMQRLQGMSLAEPFALQTGLRLAIFEKRMRGILDDFQKMATTFNTPTFQKRLDNITVQNAIATAYDQASAAYEAAVADAIAAVAKEIKDTGATADLLARQKDLQDHAGYAPAIQTAMADIVSLVSADPASAPLLHPGAVPNAAASLVNAYVVLKQRAVAAGGPAMQDRWSIEWGANLLTRLNDVTDTLLAAQTAKANMAPVIQAQKDIQDALLKDPLAGAQEVLAEVHALATESAQAKAAYLALKKEVKKFLRDLRTTGEAARIAKLVLQDPAFTRYINVVNRDAGIEHRPESMADLWYDQISGAPLVPAPDGSAVQIDLVGDQQQFQGELTKLNDLLDQWLIWKQGEDAKPADQRDPAYAFKNEWIGVLTHLYTSSRVQAPAKIRSSFMPGPMGMLAFLMDDLGTRYSTLLKVPAYNFERARFLADQLRSRYMYELVNASLAAALSHSIPTKGFGKYSRMSLEWYDQVGRELFDSWQNEEGGYEEGDRLSNGLLVTKQDMEAVKANATADEAAFDIIQRKAMEGRATSAHPVLLEEKLPGGAVTFRRATKVTANTMTRKANTQAVAFTKKYLDLLNQRQTRAVDGLIDAYFDNFVVSFLADRKPIVVSGKSPYEATYRAITPNLSALAKADRTLDWLSNEVANIEGIPPDEAHDQIRSEMDELIRRMGKVYEGPDGMITVEAVEARNSFTEGRKDKLAPFWFYTTGHRTSGDFVGMVHNIPSHYFARMIFALEKTKGDLERQQRDLVTEVQRRRQGGEEAREAMKGAMQANAMALRAGQTFDDYVALDRKVYLCGKHIEALKRVYGTLSHNIDGILGYLGRFTGMQVALALGNAMTGAKVTLMAPLFIGSALGNYQGSVVQTYARGAWEILLASPRFAGAYGASLVMGAARVPAGLLRGVRTFAGTGNVRLAVADAFQRTVEELGQNMLNRIDFYRQLEQAGYYFPLDSGNEFRAKLLMPTTAGTLMDPRYSGIIGAFANTAEGALSFIDALLVTPLLKPAFPRAFDAVILYASFKAAEKALHNIEGQAEHLYQVWKKTNYRTFDLANPSSAINTLSPNEVFPSWTRIVPGKKPRQFVNYQMLKGWFEQGSPIGLQEAIIGYMAQREAGNPPGACHLFTPAQIVRMCSVVSQEAHVATALNRPTLIKEKGWLPQVVAPLMGWPVGTLRYLVRHYAASAPTSPYGWWRWFASQMFFAVLIGIAMGAISDVILEEVRRLIAKVMNNEVRPTRQPWERDGISKQAMGWLAAGINHVPFIGMIGGNLLTQSPTKLSSPDLTVFLQSRITDLINYAAGVINTGDATYGLDVLAKKTLPLTAPIINRLASEEGTMEGVNAKRLLQRYGPTEMLQNKVGSAMFESNELSPYGERMFNAALRGDDAGLQDAYQQAVEVARSLGRANPEQTVQQMYDARNPAARAFKGKLDDQQWEQTLQRMDPADRALVESVQDRFERGAQLIGASEKGAEPTKEPTGGSGPTAGAPNFAQPPGGGPGLAAARGSRGVSGVRGGGFSGRIGNVRSVGQHIGTRNAGRSLVGRRGPGARTGRSIGRVRVSHGGGTGAPRVGRGVGHL